MGATSMRKKEGIDRLGFGLIWTALALYVSENVTRNDAPARTEPT